MNSNSEEKEDKKKKLDEGLKRKVSTQFQINPSSND
jgi:hypothetical protein